MIPLERPVTIGAREAVLVDDLALTNPTGPLAERLMAIASDDAGVQLYVEQQQVDALSGMYPGLPLYGLWQTLIASGHVPAEPGLYQVVTDSSPHPNRYLLREPGGVYSGRVLDGTPLDAFAPDEAPGPTVLLEPAPESLRPPTQPIQTLRHRQAEKNQARLRVLTLAGLMALGSAFVGTAADHVLSHRHARKMQQAEQLRRQTQELQQDLARLGADGRIEPIDQARLLDQLLLLSRHFQPIVLPRASALGAPEMTGIVHPSPTLPPLVPPGLPVRQATHQPDGSLRIVW